MSDEEQKARDGDGVDGQTPAVAVDGLAADRMADRPKADERAENGKTSEQG